MQGSSLRLALRLRVAAAFALAFFASGVAVFAITSWLGDALRVSQAPDAWRYAVAAACLLLLAMVDLVAIRRASYCPLSWRRQTPRALMRRFSPAIVAFTWGLDTGLAVTTFRVAALTWAALILALLGVSGWWSGVGYGLGFVIPMTFFIWRHRVGTSATAATPTDPGLQSLLARRATAQLVSAVLLTISGALLFSTLLT